jgi:D-alanyl-D-alanine carboxypeptidase
LLLLLASWLIAGCQRTALSAQPTVAATPVALVTANALAPANQPTRFATQTATAPRPPTAWPTASATPSPEPSPTATATRPPTPTPSQTPIPLCGERLPGDDLFTLVNREYALSRSYEPADLTPLSSVFPVTITLGFPSDVRQVIVEPLRQIVGDMYAAGLAPTLISGYRSYYSQGIAWDKWLTRYPEWGFNLSAPPGHSEHQLGSTVDFGSPELDNEFTTYFYRTAEGVWLEVHAHEYGFTMSYPRWSLEVTGFYFEPWHFRYVGVELATFLHDSGLTLTEYLLLTQPPPCIPDSPGS